MARSTFPGRNIGSDPSIGMAKNALDTAVGRNRTNVATKSISPKGSEGRPTPTNRRGSWEGFMHAPSTPLEWNGSGYLAKKSRVQTPAKDFSRYGHQGINLSGGGCPKVTKMCVTGSKNGSVSKLKNLTKLNKLF